MPRFYAWRFKCFNRFFYFFYKFDSNSLKKLGECVRYKAKRRRRTIKCLEKQSWCEKEERPQAFLNTSQSVPVFTCSP